MNTIVKVNIQTYQITYKVRVLYMESESIAIRTGTLEVQIGTQQGNEYQKKNTGMKGWKGTGAGTGSGTIL